MGRIGDRLFSSKFAQRIFLLFVASAVAPTAVIALLSLTHISRQLHEQSYEHSRQTGKAIGMELFRRLSMANAEFKQIAGALSHDPAGNGEILPRIGNLHPQNLTDLAFINGSGTITHLRGRFDYLPEFTSTQLHALAAGKTVLYFLQVNGHPAEVMMARPIDPRDLAKGAIWSKISSAFLWSVQELLPASTELAVLAPPNGIVYSSQASTGSLTRTLEPLLVKSISGHLEWSAEESTYLASYWSVFTDPEFSTPYLVVIASQPKNEVIAPIVGFRNIYIPMLIMAILAVSFFAAKQIRKRLAPLVTLRDATRDIARGNFERKISIASGDEFAQLGEAFNAMASRLDKQFASLSAMAEIDQLILSSFDARYIIETVLGRTTRLTPCAVAVMLEIEDEQAGSGQLSFRPSASATGTVEIQAPLSPGEIASLYDNPNYLLIDDTTALPSYLQRPGREAGASTFLLFPMFIKKRLAAALITGYASPNTNSELNEDQLRKLADHVAVALSNANWEEQLYHQAHYDALTNLPNRALLKDRLEQAIARSQRNQSYVGVMFLDLDRFKLVNDSLGHVVGDQLLNSTAQLLVNTVRSVDTVVRFGGDEFVIIIPDIERQDDVVSELGRIADKIISSATGEFTMESHTVHSEMSIGIALYPKDGKAVDELVKNADAAMYHAKEQGRNRYEFFAPELNEAALHRLNLERELRQALENNEFVVHYQSQVDCLSGRLVGVEALIRWQHPEKGTVPPLEFIPVAEETGLIQPIGDWVLGAACLQVKAWRDAGLPAIRVAVNVSPRQFRKNDFPARVAEILKSSQLDPGMLELEVTEGTLMEDVDDTIEKLDTLNTMGVHLSVDDFGTGYSSLSYLRKLPIHSLKIDRTFILNMTEDQSTQAIVASTIYLAHRLGLGVVAEGVETDEQRKLLQNWQCDVLQGYLISKPVPCDQFKQLLVQSTKKTKSVRSAD